MLCPTSYLLPTTCNNIKSYDLCVISLLQPLELLSNIDLIITKNKLKSQDVKLT